MTQQLIDLTDIKNSLNEMRAKFDVYRRRF
jgi:hypothetical protein